MGLGCGTPTSFMPATTATNACMGLGCGTPTSFMPAATATNACMGLGCGTPTSFMPATTAANACMGLGCGTPTSFLPAATATNTKAQTAQWMTITLGLKTYQTLVSKLFWKAKTGFWCFETNKFEYFASFVSNMLKN